MPSQNTTNNSDSIPHDNEVEPLFSHDPTKTSIFLNLIQKSKKKWNKARNQSLKQNRKGLQNIKTDIEQIQNKILGLEQICSRIKNKKIENQVHVSGK